jgi:hypothetical protein
MENSGSLPLSLCFHKRAIGKRVDGYEYGNKDFVLIESTN